MRLHPPQQNGVAERINRTLVKRGRCLLIDAELEKRFWAEAVNMAAYVVNRSVNRSLGRKVPEEVWREKRIDVSNLKIFSTPVIVLIPEIYRKKLDPKSKQLVFVGYSETQKAMRCLDVKIGKVFVSRDVKFLEPRKAKVIVKHFIEDDVDVIPEKPEK